MAQIQVLDQNTINQIAAGEVVERPASVVKELLENAIDANATAITVEIKEGGISFIRITDNGYGIEKEQIPLAFLRHSTSKIRTAQDLITVSSLGFRGEALSSIASVAEVELITKTPHALNGICYCISGGTELSMEEIGAPDGTTFLIRNLFYNVPARRKFLKSPVTEGNYIVELVEKMALSHPNISIRLISNGQNKLYTTGNRNLKDMIYTIYGREVAANLIPIHEKTETMTIDGFLGKPVIARGNRSFENYFINGRYVKSKLIARAIETAYKPFMMQHRYPFAVLHLELDKEKVDVNVHPAKMELRFEQEQIVYDTLVEILTRTLSGKEFIPEITLTEREEKRKSEQRAPEPFERRQMEEEQLKRLASYGKKSEKSTTYIDTRSASTQKNVSMPEQVNPKNENWDVRGKSKESAKELETIVQNRDKTLLPEKENGMQKVRETPFYKISDRSLDSISNLITDQNKDQEEVTAQQMSLFEEQLLSKSARVKHRLIGQLFETYWLIQYEDKLFIMDQHAAHEKVLYERTIKSLDKKEFTTQMVSPPIIISLTRKEEALFQKYESYFTEFGYEISPFGGREYTVSGVPGNLFGIPEKAMLTEIFALLEEEASDLPSDLIVEKIASISCKAAVKGNHKMSFQEANALIDQLMELDNPYACPHGRPTMISMSKYELEKKFKRIV